MKSLCFEKKGRRKKTTGLSSFRKQANCEIIEKVCQSRAGAQREPQDSQARLWSSTEPWRAAQGGNPRNSRPGKRNKKEDRREMSKKISFSHPFFLCLSRFSSLKYVLKRPFLPHFVELHWKRSIVNKILSSSSPLRWVTKTYRGVAERGDVTSCPHLRTPRLKTSTLTLYHHPPLPHYHESDKRKPRESVSRFPFCFFFFKVRKGLNDLTMG